MRATPVPISIDHAPKRVPFGEIVGWILVGFLIWVAHVRWPIAPAVPDLDPSWQQALSYALTHDIRFGRDLVFTFGPLGGPEHGRYEPALFWSQILFYEILFKGLLAWRWVCALRRWSSGTDRVIFVVALLSVALGGDAFMLSSALVVATSLLKDERHSRVSTAFDFALLFAIGYVKFTYLALGLIVGLLVVTQRALTDRRRAVETAIVGLISAVIVWMVCGQSPLDLPLFIWRSSALASGYTESQAQDGASVDVSYGVASLCLTLVLLGYYVYCSRPRSNGVIMALCVAFGTLAAFRASFTFHTGPAVTFFAFTTLMPIALVLAPDVGRVRRTAFGVLRAATVVLAITGFSRGFQSEGAWTVLGTGLDSAERALRGAMHLPELRTALEQQKALMERHYALPRIQARVREAEIDFLGNLQAWIFLNNLNWKPRPVFQSYATTTAGLIELNGRFYAGKDAPEYVLYQGSAIFSRLSGTDDSGALRALLQHYRPVILERGLLLFQRDHTRDDMPEPKREIVAEFELKPGEPLRVADIAGPLHIARFDVRYSWLGRLRTLAYHAPITSMQVWVNDTVPRARRLVPGMTRAGVVLRPVLEYEEDWIDQYTIGVEKLVVAFAVGSPTGWDAYYEPTYRVTIETCEGLLPEMDPAARTNLVFGCFPTPPYAEFSALRSRYFCVDQREYVLVSADSRLLFETQVGPQRLTGVYGMLADIVELSDGVNFSVVLVSETGESRTLMTRTLDRTATDAQRALFDLTFEAQAGDHLEIITSNQPGHTDTYDIQYLEGIRISATP